MTGVQTCALPISSEVLVINIDEIDYVNNEEDKKKVLSMIEEKLNEIRNR